MVRRAERNSLSSQALGSAGAGGIRRAGAEKPGAENADLQRPPRHHLPLPPAGGVRRASDDVQPREGHDQRLLSASLKITPEPASLRFSDDALGNRVGVARFSGRADTLVFESTSAWSSGARIRWASTSRIARSRCRLRSTADELSDLRPYLTPRHARSGGRGHAWAQSFLRADEPTPTLELLTGMIDGIHRGLQLRAAAREGHPEPGGDARARLRHLPRLHRADDRGAARARAAGALRLRLSLRAGRAIAARCTAAARRMPGCRSTCPAPAGSTSIRPTPSSAMTG